jgi:uncharacterized damage-inducible protein DinB
MIDRYRYWYEHECDCNDKMLGMLESVPVDRRTDPSFARALILAAHLGACRENWLIRMTESDRAPSNWWPEDVDLESLRPRFQKLQAGWTSYLANLTDEDLKRDFEFAVKDGTRFRWNIEGQIVQLVGHAFYHRGQIAILVDQLGGETVDTDYLYWVANTNLHYGQIS